MNANHVARNEFCPCGSGKKFKKCCLSSGASVARFTFPPATEPAFSSRPSTRLPWLMPRCSVALKKWHEVAFDAPLDDGGRLQAILLYSDIALTDGKIRNGANMTLDLPDLDYRGSATVVAIRSSTETAEVEGEVSRVVQFRDDDDLGKALYGKWEPPQAEVERWRRARRHIRMRMDFPDRSCCEIELIRKATWLEHHNARVGLEIFLDLEHVGVRGWATVLEILPCGPIDTGAGEPVTGTFKFSHGSVVDLVLESEPEPIGVTATHPFWSCDRQAWVSAAELRPGETVKTLTGTTAVERMELRSSPEPVYNIEVEGDHVYRVGVSGVLVHNASVALKRCNKIPPSGHERDYQLRACGSAEYLIEGNGDDKCADSVEGNTVVDCKSLSNPNSSPQLGTAPQFIAARIIAGWRNELKEYETIISDPCNNFDKLVIRVEDQRQVAFWQSLMSGMAISTAVEHVP